MYRKERPGLRQLCAAIALAVTAPLALATPEAHPLPAAAQATLATAHPLRARIVLPDGSAATVYTLTHAGQPSVGFRHGDTLSVSTALPGGIRRTTYDPAHPAGIEQFMAATPSPAPIDQEPAMERPVGPPHALATSGHGDPGNLHFSVFLHDDIKGSIDAVVSSQLGAWMAIMENELFPDRQIIMSFYQRVPGLTDVAYGHETAMGDWSRVAEFFQEPTLDEPGASAAASRKLLLVARPRVSLGNAGQALPARWTAMATVAGNSGTAAHELGHLMGATHENARRWEDPRIGFCATYMWHEGGEATCNDYSLGNRELIKEIGSR